MQMVHWTYETKTAGRGIVLADGCCDAIVETRPGAAPEILTTGLDAAPRSIRNTAGQTFSGIRLPPGVAPPPADLLPEAATSAAWAELLGQTVAAQEETAAIAACLAGPGGSLSLAAAMPGSSPGPCSAVCVRRAARRRMSGACWAERAGLRALSGQAGRWQMPPLRQATAIRPV